MKGWLRTNRRRVALLVGFSSVACAAGFASAASAASTVTVNCGRGGDLQRAIDASTSDTTIVIRGTCHGNFVVPTEGLGALTLQGTPGAALDGQGTGAALSVNGSNLHPTRMVSVQSLRVTNGRPGITVSSYSTIYPLTLRNVVVTGNESTGSAAGISVTHATLNLFSSSVSGNDGIGLSGYDANINAQDLIVANNTDRGIDGSETDLTLDHTVVSGNTTSGVGGGIRISGGFPLDLTDSSVSGNQASEGGGIAALDATVRLTGSAVVNNVASGDGGGIYSAGASFRSLRDCEFDGEPQHGRRQRGWHLQLDAHLHAHSALELFCEQGALWRRWRDRKLRGGQLRDDLFVDLVP